ncbi:MAG: hypothetical protein PHW65_06585, partial [Dehalococcoidales bacterium]|nr:hypothetical protein [Dehalococcoidales bacterium]
MKKNLLTLLLLILSFSLMWAADINYKFTNSTVTYSGTGEDRVTYYEFDVVAWVSNIEPVILNTGHVYIEYNTSTFGTEVVGASKVSYEKKGPFSEGPYNIYDLQDAGSKTIVFTYEGAIQNSVSDIDEYYSNSYIPNNANDAVTILHIKIEVLPTLGATEIQWSTEHASYDDPNLHFYCLIENSTLSTPDFDGVILLNTTYDDVIFLDGNGDPALPVTLESFIADYKQGAVELEWSTASETQNAGFILKRAVVSGGEALAYEVITSYLDNDDLTGAGTTTERHVYTYSDRAVRPGAAYSYILEDVDYSGNIVQHDPVSVLIPENVLAATADFRLEPAYPNPFNPAFTLPFSLNRTMDVRITMYDLSGRQVRSIVNSRLDAGTYSM